MSYTADSVALASELIRIDTSQGREDDLLEFIAPLLMHAGFEVTLHPWRERRSNLVAHFQGGGDLVFSAHADTVPFDESVWSFNPLGGEVRHGRVLGRGASDMKSGLAAMVSAGISRARSTTRGFTLIVTSSEEVGCLGAKSVASTRLLPADPILIVGEATGNNILYGHKGATWLQVVAKGLAAHASRPDLGVNAVELLAKVIADLAHVASRPEHPGLGRETTNIGVFAGGIQTNLVPDHATMALDLRTVTADSSASFVKELATRLDRVGLVEWSIDTTLDLAPIWSSEKSGLANALRESIQVTRDSRAAAMGAPYFTDAAVLAGDPPRAFVLGPGDPAQPHTVDEHCTTRSIVDAVHIYERIIDAWSGGVLDVT